MSRVRWTDEAVGDLASIKDHVQRDSPRYAQLIVERLIELAEQISSFPMADRVVQELGRLDIREVTFGAYRIVYWDEGEGQHVLTIFHSSRLMPLIEGALR